MIFLKNKIFFYIILFFSFLFPQSRKNVSAKKISEKIQIDGILSEESWKLANSITDFKQRLPIDGNEPTEKSEMKILYDEENLYFGFIFFDSEPDKIRSTILNRGGWIHRDDKLEISIDTYLDRRNAYLFEMNPFGTQDDALITDEKPPSLDEWAWDGIYVSEGRITDFGWILEVAIPWNTLSFPSNEELIMGLAVKRYINRKNESVIWPHIGLEFGSGIYQVSQYANLVNIKNINKGNNFKIKPYVIAGSQNIKNNQISGSNNLRDSGVDIYYGLRSNFTINLTYNTDFAQVEADNAQINLNRFNLFYPEKREFFLTRSKLFAFGNPRQTEIFFSRRIGLNENVVGGSRLFGQFKNNSFGMLNIHTNNNDNNLSTSYSAFRLRKDIRSRSTFGAIFTNVSNSEINNSVFGIDAQARFWGNSSISLWHSHVQDSRYNNFPKASMIKIDLRNDKFFFTTGQHRVDENFDPLLGFVQRKNMIGTGAIGGYTPRIGSGNDLIRQLAFSIYLRDVKNQSRIKETGVVQFSFDAFFENRDKVGFKFFKNTEILSNSFELANGIKIEKGSYDDLGFAFNARSNQSRTFWGDLNFTRGNYFGGGKTSLIGSVGRRFSNHLTIYASINQNNIEINNSRFSANIYGLSSEIAINKKWFIKTLFQYDNFTNISQIYIRLNWIHTPGSDLFVVVNEKYNHTDISQQLLQNTIVMKLTYQLQL